MGLRTFDELLADAFYPGVGVQRALAPFPHRLHPLRRLDVDMHAEFNGEHLAEKVERGRSPVLDFAWPEDLVGVTLGEAADIVAEFKGEPKPFSHQSEDFGDVLMPAHDGDHLRHDADRHARDGGHLPDRVAIPRHRYAALTPGRHVPSVPKSRSAALKFENGRLLARQELIMLR